MYKKIWIILALIGIGYGSIFIGFGEKFNGIIFMIFGIYSLYRCIGSKERIDQDTYKKFYFIKACKSLCDNKDFYLAVFKDDAEYYALKELFDHLPKLYNDYAIEVLRTPLQLTRPVSPYTAAAIGTQIGGVAVGVAAAQNALKKQEAYEKNVKDVIMASIKTGNALDKVTYCYESIISIILKKPISADDWRKVTTSVDNEIREKYRVN